MKTRTKYLAGAALVLALVLGGTAVSNSSEFLKGAFPGSGATWALNTSSPSGAATVDSEDELFVFDVTAPSTRDVDFGEGVNFDFTFYAKGNDIDAFAPTTELTMVDSSGHPVGYGYMITNSAGENPTLAWASVYFKNSNYAPSDVDVAAGTTETYTLKVDTETLLNEDSSSNSLLVSMKYGNITLTGNTLQY